MNIKRLILCLSASVLFLQACKKIELKPTGLVQPDEAFRTESDVLANLNACYTPLRGDNYYGGRYQIVTELMADLVENSGLTGDYFAINTLNTSGSNGIVRTLYTEPYVIIQRANVTLEKLNLVSATNKSNAQGQAKFMRAFSHFELVRLFAQPFGFTPDNSHLGVVIRTTSEMEVARKRNTVKEVYDQVIRDMREAEGLLPATNGIYPTSWAAKAMLARIYFQMNRFDSAYYYSNQVIANSGIAFDNSAAYINNRMSNPHTSEAIWWLVNEPQVASFGALRNVNGVPTQSLGLRITKTAYDQSVINANDRRRVWYKDSLTSTGTNIYSVTKYNKNLFELPMITITEMKLTRAESAAELNQNLSVAVADINDITNRAYGGTLTPLATSATPAAIIARVRNERRLEMVFENGDRLHQIKRIGAKGEISTNRNAPWNCNGLVLQIPATEFNVNTNFVQNPTGGCF